MEACLPIDGVRKHTIEHDDVEVEVGVEGPPFRCANGCSPFRSASAPSCTTPPDRWRCAAHLSTRHSDHAP